MRRVSLLVLCFAVLSGAAFAQMENKQVADEVMAVTKAQWAAEMKKDFAAADKNVAEEYTQFDSAFSVRLNGKALNARVGEALASGNSTLIAAEMVNPKVQVHGDVAILSYNFVGVTRDKEGKTAPTRAKSTRVYVKKDGQWWLVHANFGADPAGDD